MNVKEDKIRGILAIIIYFVTTLCASIIISLLPFNLKTWSNTGRYAFSILYEFIQFFIILIILRKYFFKDFKEWKSKSNYYLSEYIKYFFLSLAVMYVANIIIIKILGMPITNNEQSIRSLIKSFPVLSCLYVCILAPTLEELIFRLSFYKIFKKYPVIFVILSGLIFGSMHLISNISNPLEWLYIIPYGAPGCIFAYTLYKSDNICVPISLHVMNNTLSYVLQILTMI